MPTLNTLVVCVNRDAHDAGLIEWAGLIAADGNAHVRFVHIRDSGSVPAAVAAEHPALLESAATIESAIREAVDRRFQPDNRTTVQVVEQTGALPLDMLRVARGEDADLVIVGRGPIGSGGRAIHAAAAERLARKAHCSVLVVPADRPPSVNRILVPFRDSDCSARALEQAVALAGMFGAEIVCANVYHVHSGYARIGMTYDEFAAKLETHARAEYDALLKRVDIGDASIRAAFRPDPGNDPVSYFNQIAVDEAVDMIVIGARGRSGAVGILLGHVTETLIQTSPIPVLAVKKKGETVGLLDALLTIAG